MAFALSTYMNHTGIRSREPRVAGTSEKAQSLPDRDKWLPFFPKTKKVGGLAAAASLPWDQGLAAGSFGATWRGVLQTSPSPHVPWIAAECQGRAGCRPCPFPDASYRSVRPAQ